MHLKDDTLEQQVEYGNHDQVEFRCKARQLPGPTRGSRRRGAVIGGEWSHRDSVVKRWKQCHIAERMGRRPNADCCLRRLEIGVSAVVFAQQPKRKRNRFPFRMPPRRTIRAETRLVLVDTIVTDKKGNYVSDLAQKISRCGRTTKSRRSRASPTKRMPRPTHPTRSTTWCCSSTTRRWT